MPDHSRGSERSSRESPSGGRRAAFWSATLLVPVLLLVALEAALRFFHFAPDLDFASGRDVNGTPYTVVNRNIAWRYFPHFGSAVPQVYDCAYPAKKRERTCRIFCLGESTMQGFPYEYNGALHRLLQDRLATLIPGRTIEVVNLGITAVNSYAVLDLLGDVLDQEPDLIIVYAGHNEMLGTFGVGSSEYLGTHRSVIRLFLSLQHLKVFQLVERAFRGAASLVRSPSPARQPEALMQRVARETAIPYGSELYTAAVGNFRANLSDIVEMASKRGVPVILSTVVSNLGGQPPFSSEFSPLTGESDRSRWSRAFGSARELQREAKWEEALAALGEASVIDATRADLHFETGVCLRALGRAGGARAEFEKARDLDQLRFRAPGDVNSVIRSVAAERGALLADIDSVFSGGGASPGADSLFLEHVHPNLDGYFLIAKTYAGVMEEHGLIVPRDGWRSPFPDEVYKSRSLLTLFDFEVSFLRIDNLLHHWPFSEPESTRYRPETPEGALAIRYLRGELTWEDAHYELAARYGKEGRREEQVRELLAVARVQEFDPEPLLLAGDILLTGRSFEDANRLYRAAAAISDDQYVQSRLGSLFSELQRPDSAVWYFRRALQTDARSARKIPASSRLDIKEHLAEAYLMAGQPDSARREAAEALAADSGRTQARRVLESLERGGK